MIIGGIDTHVDERFALQATSSSSCRTRTSKAGAKVARTARSGSTRTTTRRRSANRTTSSKPVPLHACVARHSTFTTIVTLYIPARSFEGCTRWSTGERHRLPSRSPRWRSQGHGQNRRVIGYGYTKLLPIGEFTVRE